MAVNVILPTTATGTKVALTSTPNSSRSVNIVTSNSKQVTSTAIGQLQGVDVSDVEDGYTLLYNEASGNWEASPFAASLGNLDGGTF
jgi:hypothetical protein